MKVQEIYDLLNSQYDYISKIDAIRYIKGIDSRFLICDIVTAYKKAYE